MSTITQKMLDVEDGIYAGCWRGAMLLPKTCNANAIAKKKPMLLTLQS